MKGLDCQAQEFDHLTPGPIQYNKQDLKSEYLDSSFSSTICQLCNLRKTIKLGWPEPENH